MLLEARDIVKRFPGVTALDGVSLRIERGEIVSVVGENGAGKSTLMKIIAGDQIPDQGHILVNGSAMDFREPRDAMAAGIVLIHQELSLADNLDVGANIILGREPRRGPFLDHPETDHNPIIDTHVISESSRNDVFVDDRIVVQHIIKPKPNIAKA